MLATINSKLTDNLLPDTAPALLQGEVGTEVELGIHTPSVRALVTCGVGLCLSPASTTPCSKPVVIGYIEITLVQATTAQEIDAACLALSKEVKGLILDLRGNPGGLFESAIDTLPRGGSCPLGRLCPRTDP